MEQDFYLTIRASLRAPELKIKGSRFIADIFPIASKEEIEVHLASIKKEFYDATHHCYAYRLGINGDTIRAADDGEPSGTAGKPILLALTSKELTNCILIVTRYYGGTNLGTGGLSRAYYEAAALAVEGSASIRIYLTDGYQFLLNYEDIDLFERLVHGYEAKHSADYGEKVLIKVDVRKSLSKKFEKEMDEKFYGVLPKASL
jgi:uncharacterized YigZ family protein